MHSIGIYFIIKYWYEYDAMIVLLIVRFDIGELKLI